MNEVWSWVLSLTGLVGIWLAGSKRPVGWAVLLASEVLWIAYALTTHQLGFLVGGLLWAVVYTRNLIAWRSQHAA